MHRNLPRPDGLSTGTRPTQSRRPRALPVRYRHATYRGGDRDPGSEDEVGVPELVPEVALPQGLVVDGPQAIRRQEGGEQVQVAGFRLVEAGDEAVGRAQAVS